MLLAALESNAAVKMRSWVNRLGVFIIWISPNSHTDENLEKDTLIRFQCQSEMTLLSEEKAITKHTN